MGLNEVMNAGISGVTYYIYVKDGIRPRFRLLIDTIWLSVVGIATLIAIGGRTATCKCSSLRFISSGLGLVTFVTDGSSRPKLEESFAQAFSPRITACVSCDYSTSNLADLPKFSLQKKRNSLWFIFYKISKEVIMSKIKRYVYIEVQTSLFIGQNKNLVEYRFTSYSKRKRKSFLFEYFAKSKV